jgi:hypothetical protein
MLGLSGLSPPAFAIGAGIAGAVVKSDDPATAGMLCKGASKKPATNRIVNRRCKNFNNMILSPLKLSSTR